MGAVDTTYTFTATDTITSGKMNNIIDQTVMTSDAVFVGGTVEVSGGKLRVRSGSITSNELGSSSVTTNTITDLNVTTAKIANLNITTGKIADSAITSTKLSTDSVETEKIKNANITAPKLSGAQTGNAPIFGVRAWGSVASNGSIIGSGNIASVTNTGTGLYTIVFSTALPSDSYSITLGVPRISTTSGVSYQAEFSNKTTTGFNVRTLERSGTGDRVIRSWDFDFIVVG